MFPFTRRQSETTAAPADEQRSLAEPTAFDFAVFGATPSLAGVAVNPVCAMRVPAVAAGVKALAEATGILPLPAYRRGQDGSRAKDTDHAAYRLLNFDANPWTRGSQLRELMTADAIAYGDGFALIVRDGAGEPRELHRIHPTAVAVEIDRFTSEPRYRVTLETGQRLISYTDIIHLRAPATTCTDAVSGTSPLMQARDAIGCKPMPAACSPMVGGHRASCHSRRSWARKSPSGSRRHGRPPTAALAEAIKLLADKRSIRVWRNTQRASYRVGQHDVYQSIQSILANSDSREK